MTDPDRSPPLGAMTRLLAEMQTSLMAAALPLFEGRVDRFMIYALIARRSLSEPRPTPVLSLADSLGLPFETVRRNVQHMVERGLCRRERAGVVCSEAIERPPLAALVRLTHDLLVRLIADMEEAGALPAFGQATRPYHWHSGWATATDLMLATAQTNRHTHHDRLDLVLFSTIHCANLRGMRDDLDLARRHAMVPPPVSARVPVRPRALASCLGLPEATVRRRLDRLLEGPIEDTGSGLVVNERWSSSPEAVATSSATWANMRRLFLALATQGFPFGAPETAYLDARPPAVTFS